MLNNKIAISGAGIGGLALALALQRTGVAYSLYDKAASFEPIGYGIQLSPNAVRVLQALGLSEGLASISNSCQRMVLRDANKDRLLLSWSLQNDVPYYQCLRSDLHHLLYEAVGQDTIHYGCEIKTVQDVAEAFLVGADGVHSHIRKNLYSDDQAQFSGYVAYRAVVPFDAHFATLKNATTVWLSEDKHIVVYPVGRDNQINIALVAKQQDILGDSWVQAVNNDEIVERFTGHSHLLNDLLQHLHTQNTQSYCWGLFDYQSLPAWYQDNNVLLGDAAHPMLPFMAQGAAMAIEDAWVLAQCLKSRNSFETACQQYEQLRMRRASKVQAVSRKNAAIFHATGLLQWGRNHAFRILQTVSPELMRYKTNWLYDYDVIRACANIK